jgi:sec-independent protein translocase protein TatB
MFGMGIGEIVVIIVVALLFIGPEKLPEAAKSLSKGIRDIRKQTRELRDTIEEDTEFGGAIRDLQSALRGEDNQAVFNARRKLAAQKSATPKPGSDLLAPSSAGPELAAGAAAIAGSAPATEAGTPGTDISATPAALVGAPVITASAGAVARGSAAAPPATDTAPPAPETGSAGDGIEEPAATKPAPGDAHG